MKQSLTYHSTDEIGPTFWNDATSAQQGAVHKRNAEFRV